MAGRLRKAASLSPREWATLAWAWWVLPAVRVGLDLVSLPRMLRLMDPGDRSVHLETTLDGARRAAWLVGAAAAISPVSSNCLSRSVVLWRLLRR